jgi:Ca2+-binding EF-hand superfamily protein
MPRIPLIAASAAAVAAGAAAFAQPAPPVPPAPPHAMHIDHDGRTFDWDVPKTRAEVEKRIAEHFAAADADKDGAVTQAEFDAHIKTRIAEAQAKMRAMHAKMFDRLDGDGNGQISRSEWDAHHTQMMSKVEEHHETAKAGEADTHDRKNIMVLHGGGHPMPAMAMLHRGHERWGAHWFKKNDANGDGKVTLAEARARPLEHFDRVDTNKDGTLSPEERRATRKKMREEWKAKRGA